MNLANKFFRIVKEDTDGVMNIFPELKVGVEFKVISVENDDDKVGIVAIHLRSGEYLHINSRDSWYWCFWEQETMDEIEEIEELSSDQYKMPDTSNLFDGRLIVDHLLETSKNSTAEYDYYEANMLTAAAEYILKLEKQLEFSDRAF